MDFEDTHYRLRLAVSEEDQRAAERLRYSVFVEELGGDGDLVDHDARLERDEFDPIADHLVLIDERRDPSSLDHVVGVYRLLTEAHVAETGRFYSETEYDLRRLKATRQRLLSWAGPAFIAITAADWLCDSFGRTGGLCSKARHRYSVRRCQLSWRRCVCPRRTFDPSVSSTSRA